MTKQECRLVSEIRCRVRRERSIGISLPRLISARRDFAASYYAHSYLVSWFAEKAGVDWLIFPNGEIRFFEFN